MKLISRFYLLLALLLYLSLSGCGGGSMRELPPPPFTSGLYTLFVSSNSICLNPT